MANKRTRNIWGCMKQRCLNMNHTAYRYYGDRGIKICDRWLESFDNFLEDMGDAPEGLTIDRIDNNGNYEKSNCRWITMKKQNKNKRISNGPRIKYNPPDKLKIVKKIQKEALGDVEILIEKGQIDLKKLRKALNLTQEELADEIGYSREHLNYIERGIRKPGKKLFRAIEEKLTVLEGVRSKNDPETAGDKFNKNNIGY
jgi:DNA-binding XRE family transcriptional regulator